MKLGVNIDHVATLREARYRSRERGEPDVIEAGRVCERAGAHGITVHLREDRRHIQDRDVWKLREILALPLNLEMANAPEIVDIALKLKPATVCLVPERRQEVTTEGGLDVAANGTAIAETCKRMNGVGIAVSLFIAPDLVQIDASAAAGAQYVELHTGAYAEHFPGEKELERLLKAARHGRSAGLRINAGHGLNYQNVSGLHHIPHLEDLNIGHSIISRAVFVGLADAVKEMLRLVAK
ncbi:MAG TPA: pyridoxine 5'-phosphate synthase [Verrucomicrobiae bacterium]|nr:pyridoxine 5'-phosphate synthase [Verrucomicrobiae bacterium]